MKRLLEDKAAIVTGGGKDLGFAIANGLAIDGAKVLVVSRQEERARQAAAAIAARGGIAVPHVEDVTRPDAARRIIEAAAGHFGGLDILVNSAGAFVWKPFLELAPEDWDLTIATNLTAPFHLTREAARLMIDQGRGGSIINITSIHGTLPEPQVVAQCA